MADVEKVIKGLELCKQDAKLCFSDTECPYQCEFPRCCLKLMADALELLKEHEEHEKLLTKLGYHWTGSGETLAMCRMKDGEQDGI